MSDAGASSPFLDEREWNTLMYAVRHYEAALRDDERSNGPYNGPLETAAEVAALGDKLLAAKHEKGSDHICRAAPIVIDNEIVAWQCPSCRIDMDPPTSKGSTVRSCWSCGHDTENASGLCDPCTVASEHPSEKGSS